MDHDLCEDGIDKSVPLDHCHHSASLVMLIGNPRADFPIHPRIKDRSLKSNQPFSHLFYSAVICFSVNLANCKTYEVLKHSMSIYHVKTTGYVTVNLGFSL